MGTDRGQRIPVLLEPFPHPVDVVDAKITREDE
jgi:hypothetical protein